MSKDFPVESTNVDGVEKKQLTVVEEAFEKLQGIILKDITAASNRLSSSDFNNLERVQFKQNLLDYIQSCVTLVKDLEKSKCGGKDKKDKKESKEKKEKDAKEKDAKDKDANDKSPKRKNSEKSSKD